MGNESVINISVKDISLDALVSQRLSAEGLDDTADSREIANIRNEMEAVKQARDNKLAELQVVQNNAQRATVLQQECDALKTKRVQLSQRLDKLRDSKKSQSRALDAQRRQLRQEILSGADIICTTLSGSGSEQLVAMEFTMVIIDEAAQAVELSSLIPLKYQSERYIMVGGKLSRDACQMNYHSLECRSATTSSNCTLSGSYEMGVRSIAICTHAEVST